MNNHIKAVVVDDDTIVIEGHQLAGTEAVADVLRAALHSDPHFILVIEAAQQEYFKGIGTVIYASQRAGMPVENLRFTTGSGEVVTLDELRARGRASSS